MRRPLKRTLAIVAFLAASGFLVVMLLQLDKPSDESRIEQLLLESRQILDRDDAGEIKDLEPVLAETCANFPANRDLCLVLIETRMALDDPEGAIEAAKACLEHNPSDSAVLHQLALAYSASGQCQKAYDIYRDLQLNSLLSREIWLEYIVAGRKLWEEAIAEADALMKDGRKDAALEAYTRAARHGWGLRNISEGLASARLFFAIAEIYDQKHDLAKAIQALRSGLRLDPWHADRHLQLAKLEEETGLTKSAMLHYRASLIIDPDQTSAPDTRKRIGSLGSQAGESGDAPHIDHDSVIFVMPLGDTNESAIFNAVEEIKPIVRCRFEFLAKSPLPESALMASGKYDADRLFDLVYVANIDLLRKPGVLGIVAVTSEDLGLQDFDSYVYSWASEQFAVASYARLEETFYDKPRDPNRFHRRLSTQLLMCCGKIAGLDQCENVPCCMAYPGTIGQIDLKEPAFCERCGGLFHVCVAARELGDSDPVDQLEALLADFPDDAAVHMRFARLLLDSGNPGGAGEILRGILEDNPANFDAEQMLMDLSAKTDSSPQSEP